MLSHETLQQLIRERRSDREREAEAERLALEARTVRVVVNEQPLRAALLGRFLAARRHALS
jgi:hypothetical protein